MAQLVLGAAGAAVGFFVGGPTGAQIGWAIGSAVGGSMAGPTKIQGQQQSLMDLKVTGTEYGQAIPWVRGAPRLAGQMWWNTDRRATTTTTVTESGGKGGGGTETSSSTISYDMDCLIGLANNEIVGISRIWWDGKLIYTADAGATAGSIGASAVTGRWTRLTVYPGSMTQLPDPTYEAAVGAAQAPAYRGRAYVFIQGLQLGQSGQVPNLTFEVVADGTISYVGVAPFATFDAANKNAAFTLSNEDLTATCGGSGSVLVGASSTASARAVGKWYYEALASQIGASGNLWGLVPHGTAIEFSPGYGSTGGYGIANNGFLIYNNGSNVHNFGVTIVAGDRISVLFDADALSLNLWVNGVAAPGGAYTSVAAGSYVPAVGGVSGQASAMTLNFGGSAFTYTPTSGYSGWGDAQQVYTIAPPDVDDVVSALCLRAGLTAGQIDVTGLASITRKVRALAVSQIAPTRQALELLMAAYFFEMVLSDKLYFRPRGGASVATIPYLDLGASAGDEQPEPLALRQMNELEIPAQIALSYINVSKDHETDTQYSDRLISAASGTLSAVQMAIGMTPAEAKAVADTMLLDQAASVVGTKVALLGDYSRLEPTDPVTLTGADGSTFRMRLVKRLDSYPLLEFDAVLDDVSVLTWQGITSADYTPGTVVAPAVNTEMELMDIPILRDADNDPGFYVATKGDGDPYPGSAVFGSPDNVEFTRKATVLESAVFGSCTTTLGDWTGGHLTDEKNSVTVDVGDGTLASSTRDVVLDNGEVNAMLIGSEVIQFITATLVSAGVYTLSRLLRGRRGTEWAMTGHAASERAVLLRMAGLRRVAMPNSELGLSRYYKGVTLGRALSSATAEQFTDNAVGLKPFAPINLRATRDGSNNVTFTLQRRTRLAVRKIGALGISVPLGEESEAYRVDVYSDGTYATLLRSISATSTTISYSAAEQTTDGLTPGDPVYVRAYQYSTIVGRGYKLEQAA